MKTWYLTKKTPTNTGNDLMAETVTQLVKDEETGKHTTVTGKMIKTVSDIDALRVRIDAALQVVKGELTDATQGVDYFGIILSKTPLALKVQELCRVINNVEGVKNVTFKEATVNSTTGVLTFAFNIQSVYGDLDYDKEVETNA